MLMTGVVGIPPTPMVPPVVKNTVSGAPDTEPTVHTPADGRVMFIVTVHVSPGVVKVVGADVPSVQLASTFTFPAVLVVHAVANELLTMPQSPVMSSNKLKI